MYKIEHIAQILRKARKSKALSQRALSNKLGIPQSHISHIENSMVDLKTSTLIELARSLDLELMLIPRPLINTVKKICVGLDNVDDAQVPPAYRLDEDED